MLEQKTIKKTTLDVPGMKLFNLFIIGLKKKYNCEAALCWSHFIFSLISNSVTTSSNLSWFFSAGLINEKKKQRRKKYKQTDDRPFFC